MTKPARSLTLGLVAHDRCKQALALWTQQHQDTLRPHQLIATGTTARLLSASAPGLSIRAVRSGPLGGDQQLGAMIAEGRLDGLIFLIDAMTPQPHDVDIKALLRLCILYEVPLAVNLTTASLLIGNTAFLSGDRHPAADPAPLYAAYASRSLTE